MKRIIASGALLLSICSVSLVYASPVIERGEDSATMQLGNDRYIAGGTVDVKNAVIGDAVIMGGTVHIAAPVTGDVQSIGGTVTITGNVRGNIRIAGGNVTIAGNVGGNVLVLGGTVTFAKSSTVAGSVLAAGGQVTIDGTVQGDVTAQGGAVTLNGTVRGKTDLRGDDITFNGTVQNSATLAARTLVISPKARINGNLSYWSKAGEQKFSTLVQGKSTFDTTLHTKEVPRAERQEFLAAVIAVVSLFGLLSTALVILALQVATKTFFKDAARHVITSPWHSFLWGVLFFILTPVAIAILMLTVIGIPLALALLALYVVSVFLSVIESSIVLARLLEHKRNKKWSGVAAFFVSLLTFVLLKIIGIIPVIGWLVVSVLICMAYGAVLKTKVERYKKVM